MSDETGMSEIALMANRIRAQYETMKALAAEVDRLTTTLQRFDREQTALEQWVIDTDERIGRLEGGDGLGGGGGHLSGGDAVPGGRGVAAVTGERR